MIGLALARCGAGLGARAIAADRGAIDEVVKKRRLSSSNRNEHTKRQTDRLFMLAAE
jgi:hypothetical protein